LTQKPKNMDDGSSREIFQRKLLEMLDRAEQGRLTGKATLTVNYADGNPKSVEILVPERVTI